MGRGEGWKGRGRWKEGEIEVSGRLRGEERERCRKKERVRERKKEGEEGGIRKSEGGQEVEG